MVRSLLFFAAVTLSFGAAVAASEMTSGRTFVHVRPEMNIDSANTAIKCQGFKLFIFTVDVLR